ncbi:nanos homolog 3 [Zophobas morio]|uniref:nanos homolog 3 n=1 Tax=Zophobas morio TaxID=2755281 RepID=UPI0030834576
MKGSEEFPCVSAAQSDTDRDAPHFMDVYFVRFYGPILAHYHKSSSPFSPKNTNNVPINNHQHPPSPLRSIENINTRLLCTLCRKNGEPPEVFFSHCLRSVDGKIMCPVLRKHICDLCGATGDYAHTRSHCPQFNSENVRPTPKYRILSNGKATRIINHK